MTAPLASAKAATVIGGTDLLTGSYLTQVSDWLSSDPTLTYGTDLRFTNIFDKEAGSNTMSFHTAVDGRGPTVTIMEVTETIDGVDGATHLIGGFNPQSWDASIGFYVFSPVVTEEERTAFIFDLTKGERRDQGIANNEGDGGPGRYQTFNSIDYGPTFGAGLDITTNLLVGSMWTYSYCVNPAENCGRHPETGNSGVNFFGTSYYTQFRVGQLETFTVETVPIPAALPLFATGLGVMGWLGWRSKRKAKAP
jgi:hypothetical protein